MNKMHIIFFALMMTLSLSMPVIAGEVEIVNVKAEKSSSLWRFNVTLRHADSGWDHYADAWRVVTEDGKEIGTRTLFHPHEDEQPFTRSLGNLKIPASATHVYVEAHDKVHGWAKQRYKVLLK